MKIYFIQIPEWSIIQIPTVLYFAGAKTISDQKMMSASSEAMSENGSYENYLWFVNLFYLEEPELLNTGHVRYCQVKLPFT